MALLFTGFVYIPFGDILLPFLDFWRHTAQTLTFSDKPLPTQQFRINPERISAQMFYYTVTAHVVNITTEVIVPYVKQKAFAKAKELQSGETKVQDHDHAEEAAFLKRVREECALDIYDVEDDYREMVMQFGTYATPCARLLSTKAHANQVICPYFLWRGHWRRVVFSSTIGWNCEQTGSRLPSAAKDRFLGGLTPLVHGSMPLGSCRGLVVLLAQQSFFSAVVPKMEIGARHHRSRRGDVSPPFSSRSIFTS